MACCRSEDPSGNNEKSKKIDQTIKSDKRNIENVCKLLLLGTGDSGKSTFLKQMKIITNNGFTMSEIERYRRILRDNTLKSIQVLVRQAVVKEAKLPNKLQKYADVILSAEELDSKLSKMITDMWESKPIQRMWGIRNTFQIHCSADYYLNNCNRFAKDDFTPTTDDVLRARMRTSGVVETRINVHDQEFSIIDVGGQRTERRKWIHFFEDVYAVIFLAAVDEYDMTLEEDQSTNRIAESLKLFEEVTSSVWFKDTIIVLFLNKIDLFKDKIKKSPLKNTYPDYTGGNDFDKAITYIEDQYKRVYGSNQTLYIKHTCAVDTDNIQHIFHSIKTSIFNSGMDIFIA